MELEVQRFLKQYSLEDLKNKFFIKINRHKKYPNLVQLKYDQIDSPMREKIVQECRGLILDADDNWKIVAFPFEKFFNYHEFYAKPIAWDKAKVYEKLDGSIMVLYAYDGTWQVASASLPDASGEIRNTDFTIGDLFWKTWHDKKYELPVDSDFTYIFELTSPYSQVVVPHLEENITLIGARNRKTGQEESPEKAGQPYNWKIVQSFPFQNLAQVLEAGREINPMKQEGFVICDEKFNRVKVKSLQYVSIGFLKGVEDKTTDRYLLEIIKTNEGAEFLSYMKEYEKPYNQLKIKYENLILTLQNHWDSIKEVEDKRTFGISAATMPIPGVFFQLRDKKVNSVKAYLFQMKTQFLL
ncbi:MAG: 2'-5' RNA ligase, partial [Verrucomicrobia bacterium]|nr:2'-5' RNA ligase [Cytophagales bacterium]